MESAADLLRYLVLGGVVAIGAVLGIIDLRWTKRPLFGLLLAAGSIGGLIITKISPFTFAGGDHYMEGVLIFAGSALALAGYTAAIVVHFVRQRWGRLWKRS